MGAAMGAAMGAVMCAAMSWVLGGADARGDCTRGWLHKHGVCRGAPAMDNQGGSSLAHPGGALARPGMRHHWPQKLNSRVQPCLPPC